MVEVFYRINVPEEQRDEKTEYYTLTLMLVTPASLVIRQGHGWWDHVSDCSRCDETVLATFDSEAKANRMYGEQRAKILALGFVHVPSGLWTIPAPASARGLVEA
jgi:hypothetical protein